MVLPGGRDHESVVDGSGPGKRADAARLILMGKPGAGKGTQSKRIAEREGVPAVSTGDLIRAAISGGTSLGRQFRSYTERGELVPDALVLEMVEERLGQGDCDHGFLLDGFPRTVPQAEAIEGWLAERQMPLTAVVNVVVPDSVLVERAAGRRFCPRDGTSYHVKFAPPREQGLCDHCGALLQQRDDDREEVVLNRVREYAEKTAPLAQFYEARGLLREVDGVGAPVEVEARIEAALHPGPSRL